ncbi:hypothetical protein P8907_11045 [Bacillus atrophaeus]|uniref:hypothetical protein n=1 Tax=Bacillus atrophaeus TaxID=1452 RepID=UPI001CB892DD|nr:hypothetical protein [Bacillus atrophaeus]MCY8464409.1 hypothetical protein [Bacillus atrophaeus]MCY8475862.1 hypothetical protein [Bacillus atrophaeus]MCY8487203.1 hypothetical protein [Bacillus atrophaeus]MCY8809354.1 hypothetical protein [Bacillus atrophaeus]MCY8837769.1 hypothetical protein [Bacillus atrophaeus]
MANSLRERGKSFMYPNFYYDHYMYENRAFEGLVGQFITIPANLTLPNGQVLPSGTRVFIHRVNFTPAGQELVTIVFPLGVGGNCISGSAQVSASQLGGPLGGPGGVQTIR